MKLDQKVWGLGLTVLLTACMGSGNDPMQSSASAQSAGESSPGNQVSAQSMPAGLGCDWQIASNPDTANIAFPDVYAKYWVALVPQTPGTRIKIKGQYPNARYFSFNVYDPALRPVDALADREISPLDGGSNPYVVEGGRAREYEAFLAFGDSPTQNPQLERAPNTFYSGNIAAGPIGAPNAVLNAVFYRIYLSREGEYFNGGVALPEIILESADGSAEIGSLPSCEEPILPTLGGNTPDLGLNEQLTGADYPDQLPSYYILGTQEAETEKFFSIFKTVYDIPANKVEPIPDAPDTSPFNGGGGFLSNIHNSYTTTAFNRRYGSIGLIRMKVPTHRGSQDAGFGQEQIRYWSVCGNEFTTQRFTDCVADENAVVGPDGFATFVVSDEADRPSTVTRQNGFNWIPWGAYPDMILLYRQMLPASGFAEAIEYQPYGESLSDGMGDYYPESAYCDKGTLELSADPAQAFELCDSQFSSDSLPIPLP